MRNGLSQMLVLARNIRIVMMKKNMMRAIWAIAFAIALVVPAHTAETIRSFSSNVTLLLDGSVDVTETIEVRAEGDKIRRGIYRDIPTELVNDNGSRLRSKLQVISIEKDGRPEPWFDRGIEGGERIYIGDADVFLATGNYRYTIRYTMTRMARQFDDYDELFWNATGNFWDFPIEKAVASVTLPDGAVISGAVAFTGRFGSTESDADITRTSDNTATFRATREFDSYEGMSVAVKFQKGVLSEPELFNKAAYFLSDNRGLVLPSVALFLVLLYNFFAWDAVGRDPKKGTIIPLFHPPTNYSPALVHFIWAMGWKKSGWQAFTAALVNLAVKDLITIGGTKKKTKLTVIGGAVDDLPPGEQLIYSYLRPKKELTINTNTGAALHSKQHQFRKLIEVENRKTYFKNNTGYVFAGIGLSFICILTMVFTGVLNPFWMVLSIVTGVLLGLFTSIFSKIWSGKGMPRFLVFVWVVIIGTNLTSLSLSVSPSFEVNTAAISAVSIVLLNVVFAVLMRAPTVQGRKVMDQIDGFRMYLETAEKERLNFVDEPDMTVKRFESILPFAIALGVEKPWSEHFENELARNAVSDAGSDYHPHWYHGRNFSSANISRDMAAMATGMSAAMIAAQPASSSSSGFSGGGGGGSSGGGGGGGGGGGW